MPEDNNEELKPDEENSYDRKGRLVKKANLVLLVIGCILLVFVIGFSVFFLVDTGFKDIPNGEYERPFYYELNADGTGYEVTGMNERYRNVEIPAEHNGLPVTGIAEYAFYRCTSLKSLTMPDTVTSIGAYAFQNCRSLKSVTISSGVLNIGYGVFRNCYSLIDVTIPDGVTRIGTEAFYGCSSLTEISIPKGVTSIGDYAFEWCSSLETVTIGDNVMSIGTYAFSYCSSLTSVIIPDSVTEIGNYAFEWCSSLETVEFGNGVTSIGYEAFSSCDSLTGVYISSLDAWCEIAFWNEYSNPLYYAGNLYLDGELVAELAISDGVECIGNYAFYGCTSLESVVMPDSVTKIGDEVFECCSSLETVTIGDNVMSIGAYAFSDCSSLTSVIIPDSVTEIDEYAFECCSSLETVTIGGGLTYIGYYVFYKCESLTSVEIPDNVTSIGERAFSGCTSLTSVIIPDSVTEIGNGAFAYCDSLGAVYIPESVTYIGSDAFDGCSNLLIFVEVESKPYGWSSGWNSSGCPVFWGLSGIPTDDVTYTFVTNGGSAVASVSGPWLTALPTTTREGYIFTGWYSDPDLSAESRVAAPYYTGHDVTLYAGWLEGYQSDGLEVVDGVVIGIGTCTDSVLYISLPIADGAFYGCNQITEVYLYDGCDYIGYNAFIDCYNLKAVYFCQTEMPYIDSYIFSGYSSNFRVYVPADLYSQYQTVSSRGWIEDIVDRNRLYTF